MVWRQERTVFTITALNSTTTPWAARRPERSWTSAKTMLRNAVRKGEALDMPPTRALCAASAQVCDKVTAVDISREVLEWQSRMKN